MVAVELLVGAVFLIVSVCAFWFALPRGGEVRGYLRNEQVTTRSRWSLASLLASSASCLALLT
jgi:hypothetical protein